MAKRRASQQYNIEKDPLTTGRTEPGRVARFLSQVGSVWGDRWSVGTSFILLAGVLLVVWIILEIAGVGFVRFYLDRWNSPVGPEPPTP